MLQNDFFTITAVREEGHFFKVMLEINPRHVIFDGHFPGHPVVPGACLMQMVKEITETVLGAELRLKRADNLKFIALIDPTRNGLLEMQLTYKRNEDGSVNVSANLLNNDTVCFKFNGLFVPQI